ncbi:MAG: HlyD family efflux transporter periplasmic adaptor subunit [Bacteroidota bacterium]
MKKSNVLITIVLLMFALASCQQNSSEEKEQTPVVSVKTVLVAEGNIESNISLNGKTIYLKKNMIISPIAGYLKKINIKYGDLVQKNDVLFEIQTKEHKALENTNALKSNAGIIQVLASSAGIIDELNLNEAGMYVIEGGALCSIVENKDVMVQVNMPFEYNTLIKQGAKCTMHLSDHTSFGGTVSQIMPIIKESDQTQNVLIKPDTKRQLPVNLNLTVNFSNTKHLSSCLIPKVALMTNETQSEFWVMKMVNNNLAMKIPIIKGTENDSLVEVTSSDLKKNDRIIREGAYGLADSSEVKVVQ